MKFSARFLQFSQKIARWAIVPAIAIVVWGELAPTPPTAALIWDKLLHFIAYFGLSGLSLLALSPGRRAAVAAGVLILMGGVLEIAQGLVGRDASWGDEAANALGAVIGCALGWVIVRLLERSARGTTERG